MTSISVTDCIVFILTSLLFVKGVNRNSIVILRQSSDNRVELIPVIHTLLLSDASISDDVSYDFKIIFTDIPPSVDIFRERKYDVENLGN